MKKTLNTQQELLYKRLDNVVSQRINEPKTKHFWESRRGASCDQNESLEVNEYS